MQIRCVLKMEHTGVDLKGKKNLMINIYLSIYLYTLSRWVGKYDISTHPHTKHTHRHDDNRLPKLVLGSEEFATSLSFPRFQNFFWNNCLRSVLLCFFLGTRKHNSNYSLFPWGHSVDSEEPTCRWVSMGSFLAPPPSGSPSAERNLTRALHTLLSLFRLSTHLKPPTFP